jgi:Fur family transcriptional regulator, peroxide stress response regulator
LRRSRQKDAILRVLCETDSHPTAEWIYEQVKKEIPTLSLGTVYRNLRLMAENGSARELSFTGEQSRYDGNIQHHDHFRCEKCGRIFDLGELLDELIKEKVARKMGACITGHRLEITGTCRECRKSKY